MSAPARSPLRPLLPPPEADPERPARELAEAEALQRHLRPCARPQHPELDVAAYTAPASEINGDYYDFLLHDDGSLTAALGDATGHGLRAGMMVIATKTLFHTLADEAGLVEVLDRSTRVLKRMRLCRLYMSLLLARYRAGVLRLAAAGMPPVLVWRAATGEVEAVRLRGMPLGAVDAFPYREVAVELRPGDTAVLMSDGFPELLSARCGRLGYQQAVTHVAEAGGGSAAAVLDGLVDAARGWAQGRPLDDDVTFVVLRRKPTETAPDAPPRPAR
ncbi:MAG: SpoIIE family protein phosphatase [Rhodothermales bacterium]|nr:SpoIIE family protein phosphatase [Rhodothermales bacterium]